MAVQEVTVASSEHQQGLRQDLAGAKTQVLQRKVIDRANKLLTQRHTLVGQVAVERSRRRATNSGLRLSSVALRMLNAAKLLGYQSFFTCAFLNICALVRSVWALLYQFLPTIYAVFVLQPLRWCMISNTAS